MVKLRKIGVYFLSFIIFIHTFIAFLKIIGTTAPDFSVYYYSTLDLVRNINPYTDTSLFTVSNYPILTNLVYLPFTLLPYQFAQGLFIFLSLFSVIGIVYLCFKLLKIKLSVYSFLLVLCMVFSAFPVKFTLGMGQSNLLAYFGLLFGIWFYQNKQIVKSGLCISIAVLLKPILGVFLLYFLIKHLKIFIWSLIVLSMAFVTTVLWGKLPLYSYYFQHLVPDLFGHQGKEIYYNQSLTGFIFRLELNPFLSNLINYLSSIGLIIYAILKSKNQKLNQNIAVLLSLLLIINPLSWQHHFVFLIFPFMLAWKSLKKQDTRKLLILVMAYFLVSINIKSPQAFLNFPFTLILSHSLYGIVLLLLFGFLF